MSLFYGRDTERPSFCQGSVSDDERDADAMAAGPGPGRHLAPG
jgi:hypothetical protein